MTMKPEDAATDSSIISGLVKDYIGDPENLELFALLYLIEKLRQDISERISADMGDQLRKGFNSVLKGDSMLPEVLLYEQEHRREKA